MKILRTLVALFSITLYNLTTAMTTPLHLSAANGNLCECSKLLDTGAHASALDKAGNTPLLCAAAVGNIDVVRRLLKVPGIDVNKQNKDGKTALHLAAYYHHLSIVMALLMHPGTNSHLKDRRGYTPLQNAEQENNLSQKDPEANRFAAIRALEAHQQLTQPTLKAKL